MMRSLSRQTVCYKFWARRRRYGTTIIEFSIAVIAFILLMIGVVQFGLIYYSNGAVNNAAREGARYGSVHPNNVETIKNVVIRRAAGINTTRLQVDVTYPDGTVQTDSRIKVTATYQVSSILPGLPSFTITRSSIMRIEHV